MTRKAAFKAIASVLAIMLAVFLSTPPARCLLRSSIIAPHSLLALLSKNLTHSHGVPRQLSNYSSFKPSDQTSSPDTLPDSMASTKPFRDLVESRRSYYQLSPESTIPDSQIADMVKHTLLHTPSPFNGQSARIVVLLKKEHKKLWDMTREILQARVPAEQFEATSKKLDAFRNAYGSILFFEDPMPVRELAAKFPQYADKFPQWSEQTSGMHQYILWTALEAEGLGCNLQHYNPLIDAKVSTEWNIDPEWSLKSQMVFGKPTGQPGPKTFKPLEDRFEMYGAEI